MNEVARLNLSTPAPPNPMELLASAIDRGMAPDTIEKLMTLQAKWEATQARKAFDEAIAAAKAEIPPIVRNKSGHNSKMYADFSAIAKVVDPIISKHGLSYRFRTHQNERINVTCILSHKSGHFEETTLAGPADQTGNKNAIQAIGSTLTYLQRYSLVQALGLAAADDDDGKAAGDGETIAQDQVEWLQSLIVEVAADLQGFLKYFKIAKLEEMNAKEYPRAVAALEKKRTK